MMTLATMTTPLYAEEVEATQDAKTVIQSEEEDSSEKVVVVTGIRGSLQRSQAIKMESFSIVEAISAEDIGKLPDSSIAESIARMPGITSQRLDGRSSKITIRGFGENNSGTTFNGREQVSIGDNRGVEFDLYPSEIMSGVTVYKTPDATLDGEGIAGVIDLQTIKPLSKGEDRILQVNGLYEKTSFAKLNPDGEDQGFSGTVFYMDKFADDKLGVAIAYSTKNSPNQEKRWNAWGYPNFNVNGTDFSVLGGAKPFVRSSMLERDSFMAVVEYAPSNDLLMTFDLLTVDFKDEKRLRGIEIPFAWGQGSVSAVAVDNASGFITQGLTQGQRVVVRNDYETRSADLTSAGFNTQWFANDDWSLDFDLSHSKVDRKVFSLESYSGTGRGNNQGIADDIGYTFNPGNSGATFTHNLDYSDFNLIQLGGPLTWGWSSALNDRYGITGTALENTAQDGFINAPSISDELNSLKLAAEQNVDTNFISKVTYGVSLKNRTKSKKSEGFYMTLTGFPTNPGTLAVPAQYQLGSVSLDFIGMGNMIAYDPMALIRDGYYQLLSESLTGTQHLTKSWEVEEDLTAAFVSADINTEVGNMDLTGNVGVRYIKTKQSSRGFAGQTDANGLVVSSPTFISHSYGHFLPSLNLNLKLDDTQNVRFGVAKTISRARLDEMNASLNVNYSQVPDANGNNWTVSGGNPNLEPKEATGFDLTYDNYFSDHGYFSIAYFRKNLTNWIFDGTYEVDMTGVADPLTGVVPANPTATGYGKVNGGKGTISGIELSVTLPLEVFTSKLDGFGIIASNTNINTDMKDQNGNDYKLPGLSDQIQNVTFYYEKNGFQARASMRKRSDFKGDVYGLGFNTVQVDILGETIWDAQIGYDFGEGGFADLEGLSVFLQGYNLTEEPFTTLSGDNPLQVRDYQDYGSTYFLGVNYKF
ncbi:MAG: TonB-dependent receptor [Enterobacterales bacterium]|nr:TonB-dependent receptor [Enterobacterales bacterium]